jgi:hypothetical protein
MQPADPGRSGTWAEIVDLRRIGLMPDAPNRARRPKKLPSDVRSRRDAGRGESKADVTELWEARYRADISPAVLDALRSAGYEVLGELGRGGMGIVDLARRIRSVSVRLADPIGTINPPWRDRGRR